MPWTNFIKFCRVPCTKFHQISFEFCQKRVSFSESAYSPVPNCRGVLIVGSPENKSAGVAQPAVGQENDTAGVVQLASSLQKNDSGCKVWGPLLICSESHRSHLPPPPPPTWIRNTFDLIET